MNSKLISRKTKIYNYQQARSRPKHAPSVQGWKWYAMPPCTAEVNRYVKQKYIIDSNSKVLFTTLGRSKFNYAKEISHHL